MGWTWERGEEEVEGWLGLMMDYKGEEDGWASTHGESYGKVWTGFGLKRYRRTERVGLTLVAKESDG
jgi:hypothetical protein